MAVLDLQVTASEVPKPGSKGLFYGSETGERNLGDFGHSYRPYASGAGWPPGPSYICPLWLALHVGHRLATRQNT